MFRSASRSLVSRNKFPSRPERTLAISAVRRSALDPPAQQTVVLTTPSAKYLEDEELDVEILPSQDARITVTDRAAEQLCTITKRENNPLASLRISVESGGCHGYQYKMLLEKGPTPGDYSFTHPTIKPSNIVIDAVSLALLNGSTIDFATELIGSSFRVAENPNAKGSGCGCGVSWELKS
ncbi:hypothetical protein C8J56DRAFT_809744 [Mycena floridula]|nr:hypothetical protein C8J56DRAFT_809744 [Mycena floridula]